MIEKTPICGTKNGETRYYVFYSEFNELIFMKVKCLRNRWDATNENECFKCEVLQDYIGTKTVGNSIYIDNAWHLQDTISNAVKLAIILIFNNHHASYMKTKPW